MEISQQAVTDTAKKMHPHRIGYFRFYFAGLLIAAAGAVYFWPAIALGLLLIVIAEVSRGAITYYVLDSGVARGYNLFSTSRKFAEYGNIQNISVEQSFLEKMIGVGTISFDTSGSDTIEVSFEGVSDPYGIEEIVRRKMA